MVDEISMPWPQDGDNLFIAGEDWYHNACLHFLPDSLDLYIMGYKEAGDRLVTSSMEDRSHQDALVFPIVFLYRQYLELSLKRLIREGNWLLGIPSKWGEVGYPTDGKSHNLLVLWKECKKVLELVGTNYAELKIADQDLKTIEDLLTQFSQQDPGSDASRFPTDKKNNPSLPNLRTINVRNLATVMAKIASFFDAIATAVSVYLDWKREMRQYEDSGGQHTDFS